MTITRRGFLAAVISAGVAPYVMSGGIGRGVLMPSKKIIQPDKEILIDKIIASCDDFSPGDIILISGISSQPNHKILERFVISSISKNELSINRL